MHSIVENMKLTFFCKYPGFFNIDLFYLFNIESLIIENMNFAQISIENYFSITFPTLKENAMIGYPC